MTDKTIDNEEQSSNGSEGTKTMPVFSSLELLPENGLKTIVAAADSQYIQGMDVVGFIKPTEILVSRWTPGYRVTDLTGRSADEAIGQLLASTLDSEGALTEFQALLATPDLATDVFTTLLPRAGVPVKQRKYMMTEANISAVVKERLIARNFNTPAALAAFSHAVTRVLVHQGLVAPGLERKIVKTGDSFAITPRDIKRVVMTEALRDLFSEARLASIGRDMDQEATPQVIGEQVGRLFRQLSHVIPEIKLRLEQLAIATAYIQLYHIDRARVSNALQAHPALISLASIANFVAFSAGRAASSADLVDADTATVKDACNAILTLIQSAPSIESMPLSTFAEYFGEVPAASSEGIRRGLVLFNCPGQTSKMEVVDAVPRSDGLEIAAVSSEYVKVAAIASSLNNTLLTVDAKTALANLVADELALTAVEEVCIGSTPPKLLTMGVTADDLIYLALARASAVAYVRSEGRGPVELLYGCNVEEQWRMSVFAATPGMAYFMDAASVVIYTSKMRATEPRALPSRPQTFGALPGHDVMYAGDMSTYLIENIEKPYTLKLPLVTYTGKAHQLSLEIMVLSTLLGSDPNNYPDRGGAYYAAVREQGVDAELRSILRIALAYAEEGGSILSDKALSWLVERITPAMLHPSIMGVAQRALNAAVIKEGLDGRALAPQFKELMIRAFAGTLLAVLNRFDKVDGRTVAGLIGALPVPGMSIKAQLALASIPTAINANFTTN